MPTTRVGAAAALAVLVSVLLAVGFSAWDVGPTHRTAIAQATSIARSVAAGLFLTAGVLRLVHWRVLREARSGLMGSALVVLGGLCFPLAAVGRMVVGAETSSMLSLVTRAVGSVVVMAIVLRALGSEPADHVRPGRLLGRAGFVVVAAFATLATARGFAPSLLNGNDLSHRTVLAGLAVAWIGLGLVAALRGEELAWAGRVSPLLGAMGVAEVLRFLDGATPGVWTLAAVALAASIALLSSHSALAELDGAVSTDQQHLASLARALETARDVTSREQARREEMTHDACNAIAGLRAALTMLERYDGRLDETTTHRLRTSAVDEVRHLEHLIVATQSPAEDFDVDEVVASVAATRRAAGTHVLVVAGSERAHGRKHDLATALTNLLVNAANHAPGSPVVVRVAGTGDRVEVTVSDRGPGLSASHAAHVFERGVRGPVSQGSGLGLHVARTLMREQGGDLVLRERVGGATFTLSLPAAPTAYAEDGATTLVQELS